MATTNPARERMLKYLEDHFINGRRIEVDSIRPTGYRRVGEKFWWPWPDGFDYGWFCRLKEAADLEDFRHAGVDPRRVIQ